MIEFNEMNETKSDQPKGVLVLASLENRNSEKTQNELKELEALAEAANIKVIASMEQTLEKPNTGTFIGKGKVEELKILLDNLEANLVIFNRELTGSQIRNLEEDLNIRVIDRTILVLDIFASRAMTKEGKLQVELAQLSYRLPRLTGFGKSLSKLGGGIGTRGPGEKKLESDRRHIRNRMDDIKRELKTAETARKTQKSRQIKNQIPLVALVGYTNAGKSATMNCILDSPGREEKKVKSQDMLFATLDTSERKIDMGCNKKFILVDTVGFVSNLPHSLIEAFKSTLEEAVYADLILNIVDVSSEEREFQEEVTKKVLEEMGASGKILTLYNKSDLLDNPQNIVEINKKDSFLISAKTGEGMKKVLEYIEDALFSDVVNLKMIIPYNRGELIAFIYDKSRVLSEEHRAEGTFIECVTEEKYVNKLKEFVL